MDSLNRWAGDEPLLVGVLASIVGGLFLAWMFWMAKPASPLAILGTSVAAILGLLVGFELDEFSAREFQAASFAVAGTYTFAFARRYLGARTR